jgi:hypothetical protein
VAKKGQPDLKRRVDSLYGAPLEEFTALRNELAKELRGSGERDSAEEISRLRKPTAAAWSINQLSRNERPALRRVLEAGRQLRKAQESALGGGSGAALRKASAAEREAVGAAAEKASAILGSQASNATLEKVRNSLHAAAGDEEVRAAIENGRLTADHEPVGLGPFAAATGTPRPRPARGAGKQDAAKRRRLQDAQVASREATRRAEAARRELERRSDAAARAQERLAAAQADLDSAEAEAKAAAAELERAERAGR